MLGDTIHQGLGRKTGVREEAWVSSARADVEAPVGWAAGDV